MPLSLDTSVVGRVTIVRCNGRIVAGSDSESLRAHVAWLLHSSRSIVLNLGKVGFVDSSGLGTMVRVLASTRQARGHSAIGYVTPQDKLSGRQAEIHAARDRKLEEARSQRQLRRQQMTSLRFARFCNPSKMTSPSETEAGSAGTQPC